MSWWMILLVVWLSPTLMLLTVSASFALSDWRARRRAAKRVVYEAIQITQASAYSHERGLA